MEVHSSSLQVHTGARIVLVQVGTIKSHQTTEFTKLDGAQVNCTMIQVTIKSERRVRDK